MTVSNDDAYRSFAARVLSSQGCTHTDDLSYNETFGSYYCRSCDQWGDPFCSDRTCAYCAGRPAAPSLAR
jgi:hypothetical protein